MARQYNSEYFSNRNRNLTERNMGESKKIKDVEGQGQLIKNKQEDYGSTNKQMEHSR